MQRTCLLPVALAVLAITQNRGRLACASHPAQTPWGMGKSGGGLSHGAEQGFAGDGEQRPLVPRSRSSPRLKPSVRRQRRRNL
jgi:hypothetical protein